MKRVAIVGGGVGGLVACRECISQGIHATVFERNSRVGGTWRCGTSDSPIYQGLRTNLPRALMRLTDLDWNDSLPDYLTPEMVDRYITDFAVKFDLNRHIRFNQSVTEVLPKNDEQWEVKSVTCGGQKDIDIFDAVIIANGHFNVPMIPLDYSRFQGHSIHSKEYWDPSPFADKVVCVIGGGSSGTDIAKELDGVARRIYICDSRCIQPEMVPDMLDTTWMPKVSCIESHSCKLANGDTMLADAIIFCTGYSFSYEFLSESVIQVPKGKRVRPLYKHMMHAEYPSLFFLGLNQPVNPFPFLEIQAKWCVNMLINPEWIPSMETRFKHVHWMEREAPSHNPHSLWEYSDQFSYLEELIQSGHMEPKLLEAVSQDRILYNKVAALRGGGPPGGKDYYRNVPIASLL